MWMWKVDSSCVLLLQQVLIFHDDTSRWFDKHTFRPKLQICIFGIFFQMVFVVTSKIKLIPFLQSLWMPGNSTCWCILTTLKTDQILTIVCWFSSFWRHFDLVKEAKFAISGHFLKNTTERNGLKFGMLMYSDQFQNRLNFGHGMLIFLNLAPYWLKMWSNLGFPGFSYKKHEGSGLKFDKLIHPDHLWNWLHSGHGLLVFLIMAPFWLCQTGQMCSFQAFSWQCMGGMGRNFSFSSLTCDIPRIENGKF